MPSIIETTAFAFHGSGAISGSWFEFNDCMDHFHKRGVFSKIPFGHCVRLSIQRAITGLLCVYIHLLLSPYFHVDHCPTSLFANYSLPFKMVYMYVTLEGVLFFYFTAFCFLDSSNHACGISFNGYEQPKEPSIKAVAPKKEMGEPRFDRVVNIKLWKFLTGSEVREIINSWNVSIHNWLKYYVYVRQLEPGQKPGWQQNILTFLTSALWHGVYPSYYVFFTGIFLFLESKKGIDLLAQRLFWFVPTFFKKLVSHVISFVLISYLVMGHKLLYFGSLLQCYKNQYFWGHFYLATIIVVYIVAPKPKNEKKQGEKVKAQ